MSLTVDLMNQKKEKVGSLNLAPEVFGVDVNVALVHQVIKAQLAGRRRGTACTKTKGLVRGGGKKPFKQKGTGNARQGSIRSPLQPGGGQTFGPLPRDYTQATPKEMVRGALRSALTDRLNSKRLIVLDQLSLTEMKTKKLHEIMEHWELDQVLIVDHENPTLEKASRNLPRVKVLRTEGLNVYDIIRNEWIVMTKKAVESLSERLMARSKSRQVAS